MMTNRQGKLLNILIDNYIKTAEPVSSKALVKSGPFSLSSATIRNEMNALEKAGYLMQLHTSSGRVPTGKAYRLYVDNLMADPGIYVPEATKKKIHKAISDAGENPEELNRVVANIVSVLSDNIVVTNVKNSDNFYKTGLSSLFEFPEFREVDRVFNVASVFDHFDKMFSRIENEFFGPVRGKTPFSMASADVLGAHRTSNGMTGDDILILIGNESQIKNMQKEAVILVRYPLPNRKTGSMTIIGPMRMDYEKNIGLAKCVIDEFNTRFRQI